MQADLVMRELDESLDRIDNLIELRGSRDPFGKARKQLANDTRRITIKRLDNTPRNPQTRWVVGNLIPQDIVGEFVGPSTAGKTLFLMDLGAHVATGTEWEGNYIERGAVVFLVGEGENGLGKRRQAWEMEHNISLDDAPFYYINVVPNLLSGLDLAEVIEALKEIREPIRLVVVDTKSQHTAGQSEDDNSITAAFIRNLIDIRQATGAAVIYTHHTGHNNQERGRGASSAFANVDLSILLQPNEHGVVITSKKAKDWLPHKPIQARIHTVDLGYFNDQTGAPETSAVLRYEDYVATSGPTKMDRLLLQAIEEAGTNSHETVRKHFYDLHKGGADAAQKAFKRAWGKYMNKQVKNA
jgi:hypothetical protein